MMLPMSDFNEQEAAYRHQRQDHHRHHRRDNTIRRSNSSSSSAWTTCIASMLVSTCIYLVMFHGSPLVAVVEDSSEAYYSNSTTTPTSSSAHQQHHSTQNAFALRVGGPAAVPQQQVSPHQRQQDSEQSAPANGVKESSTITTATTSGTGNIQQHQQQPEQQQSTSRYAYGFLLAGCGPEKPSYRYFLYDILIASQILRSDESTADIVVLVQMWSDSAATRLPPQEEAWLHQSRIVFYYIPQTMIDTRYTMMFQKFRLLALEQYDRILYMDSDVMPLGNLDYLFKMSTSSSTRINNGDDTPQPAVLEENLIVPGMQSPANGGFFMTRPNMTALVYLNSLLEQRNQQLREVNAAKMTKKKTNNKKAKPITPADLFDPVQGWGHQIQAPDHWETTMISNGTLWDWHASDGDQGMLYYYTKYVAQSVSIVISDQVQNWVSAATEATATQQDNVVLDAILDQPFKNVRPPRYRGIVEECWVYSPRGCFPPQQDYIHFSGKKKPWYVCPPSSPHYERDDKSPAFELWFETLAVLNTQLEMNIGTELEQWCDIVTNHGDTTGPPLDSQSNKQTADDEATILMEYPDLLDPLE